MQLILLVCALTPCNDSAQARARAALALTSARTLPCGEASCDCGCKGGNDCICAHRKSEAKAREKREHWWGEERDDSPGNVPLYTWDDYGGDHPKSRYFTGEWRPKEGKFYPWVWKRKSGFGFGEPCEIPDYAPKLKVTAPGAPCSHACTCGCQEGEPCRCGEVRVVRSEVRRENYQSMALPLVRPVDVQAVLPVLPAPAFVAPLPTVPMMPSGFRGRGRGGSC